MGSSCASVGRFVLVASTLALAAGAAFGDTNVGGPILANTTWTTASDPYIVTSTVLIGANATLTIEPGVVVRFNAGLGMTIGSQAFGPGALVAQGTPANPIVFTSNAQSPDTPAPGDWKDIFFTNLAVDAVVDEGGNYVSGSILEHCVVEFAGSGDAATTGAVTAESASPFFSQNEFHQNARVGIRAFSLAGSPALRVLDSEFHDNTNTSQNGGGLYVEGGAGHVITGNDMHDNSAANGGGLFLQSANDVTCADNVFVANAVAGSGGAVWASNANTLLFADNVIQANVAGSSGGGVSMDGTSINFTGNTVTGNQSQFGHGGGMNIGGNSMSMTQNVVTGNTAAGIGGGMLFSPSSNSTVTDNQFDDNSAAGGGGGVYSNGGGGLTFNENSVSGNQVPGLNGDGGGILQSGGNDLEFTGNTISDNSTTRNGGGLFISTSNSTVSGNSIDGNSAGNAGGGVFVGGNVAFTGNEIVGNEATGPGGGLYVNAAGSSIAGDEDAFNTVSGNTAAAGSAAVFNNVAFESDGGGDLPAAFVCWGTSDLGEVQGLVFDFFDDSNKGIVVTFPAVKDCGGGGIEGDFDGDGDVDGADLGFLLGAWGPCGNCANCPADLTGDCTVGGGDLGLLLGNWG